MEVSELTESVAARFGYEGAYPILIVTDIESNGQAEQAGIVAGDLLLEINGASAGNLKELSLAMEKVSETDTVAVKGLRISTKGWMQLQRPFVVKLKATSKGR